MVLPSIQSWTLKKSLSNPVETLKVQCSYEVKAGKPNLLRRGDAEAHQTDIAAVIGMTSKSFCGSITLCFPTKVFLKIMGNMLMEEYTEIDSEMEDGAGELLNIIFGQAKKELHEKGKPVDKAIPTVVRGEKLRLHTLSKAPTVVIPFESSEGLFSIRIVKDTELKT